MRQTRYILPMVSRVKISFQENAEIDTNSTTAFLDGGLIKYTCDNLRQLQNRRLTKPPFSLRF